MKGKRWLHSRSLATFVACLSIASAGQAFAQGTWTTKKPMPTPVVFAAGGVIDGKLYVVGGSGGLQAVQIYDSATETWASGIIAPTGRCTASAGVINGKLYVAGGMQGCSGTPSNILEVYDPLTGGQSKEPMTTARHDTAAGVVNGKLYVIGGQGCNRFCNTVEAYDPVSDEWSPRAPMPTARSHHAAAVIEGKIYVIGGANGTGTLGSLEVYDPATDTWDSMKQPMPTARTKPGVGAVGGRLHVIGGQADGGLLSTHEVYDPATNAWTTDPAMNTGRHGSVTESIGGKLYVAGGQAGAAFLIVGTLEVFTPDLAAPTTTASALPAPNAAGWNNGGPVTVTLTATDNEGGSGVQSITYAATGSEIFGATEPASSKSFEVQAEGVTNVAYHARDNAGNEEAGNILYVRIDVTMPVLTVPGAMTVNATSPAGAPVSYTATATDNLVTPSIACTPASGSTFAIGTSSVSCTATDAAGNSASGGFTVTVLGSTAQATELIAFLDGLGLLGGTVSSLTSKLDNAVAQLAGGGNVNAACNMLSAFINQATAQSGNQLTSEQSAQLVASADQIRAAQGCP